MFLDPLLTWLLKDCVSVLAPRVTNIINAILRTDYFPSKWRKTFVSTVVTKSCLNENISGKYRPMFNVALFSKVLERVVHRRTSTYLVDNKLMPELQSAYRSGHSTETAVLKVFSDIIDAIDKESWRSSLFLTSQPYSTSSITISCDSGCRGHSKLGLPSNGLI